MGNLSSHIGAEEQASMARGNDEVVGLDSEMGRLDSNNAIVGSCDDANRNTGWNVVLMNSAIGSVTELNKGVTKAAEHRREPTSRMRTLIRCPQHDDSTETVGLKRA